MSNLWWQSGVIYQIYPRSFQDSNGDGIGDLRGILSRLDYLAWLGVDAIWLSPIFQSPMFDFGYDVSDYRAIDPVFGTLEDFDALVREAHARSIRVVLDFVPNHTSHLHAWFIEARSSRDNPKRDWYIWADPAPDGGPPNNWLAYFGGSAWTFDEGTGQYYLHNFLPEQPDLNYRNEDAKAAMFDSLRFWLDRGVDGFRMDVIFGMLKDPDLRDNPPNPHFVAGRDNPTHALLRVYSEGHDGIHELIQAFHQVIKAYGDDRVQIGEIPYFTEPEKIMPFYGSAESAEMDLPFNFSMIYVDWDAGVIRDLVTRYDAALPAFGHPTFVLGNHDQQRLATRVGGRAQARIAAMLLLTLRGTPFMYNGDELGMLNGEIAHVLDPQGINLPGYTRDVVRTPMLWNADTHAGFSTGEPWLPVNADYAEINVEAQRDDPQSILTLYRRLLTLRRATPALYRGGYFPIDFLPPDCFVYVRQDDAQRLLIALNFTDETRTVVVKGLSEDNTGQMLLSTHLDRPENEAVSLRALQLRPNEGVIVQITH